MSGYLGIRVTANKMISHHATSAQHILTYAQTLRGGGVERAQLRLATEWIAAGRRVTLVIGSAEGPLSAEMPAGIDVIELGSRHQRALLALPAQMRAQAPDILFCPGNHYTGIAAWTRLRLGRASPPIVAKLSNALDRPDQAFPVSIGYRAWLELHPHFIAAVVAMSPAMRDEAIAMMGLAPEAVHVIPNPPPVSSSKGAKPVVPDGRYLLGVGRLEPQKRWDRLVAAFAQLADQQVKLVIYGEGGSRAALEAQIDRLCLRDRVALPGYAADPAPAITAAAVVVLTSDFEGVPGVLRESLALGTPVVATESSVAIREIVSAPELGSVIARDDPQALVAALDHWLAPGRPRPTPVTAAGIDPAAAYLDLFDSLVSRRGRVASDHAGFTRSGCAAATEERRLAAASARTSFG